MTYRDRARGFGREGVLRRNRTVCAVNRGPDFGHHESQITGFTINEIPEIRLQLVMDAIDKAGRSIKADLLVPTNEQSQKTIKAEEMVDMRVRNEHVFKAPNFSRRQ